MRFWELTEKEVINCKDGKRLGFVADLGFDPTSGRICHLFVPGQGKFCGCFGKGQEYVIPWCQIVRIGEEIILVDVEINQPEKRKHNR